jgi:phosphodiesterase/alkaline phosphatase D-like protein
VRRWGHSGGATGYTPAVVPEITVESVWTGNVSDDGLTVVAHSPDADAVTVRYSTDPALAGFTSVAATEYPNDQWRATLVGLSPDTRYYVGFAGSDVIATVRTFPAEGATYSFGIAAASCAGLVGGDYVTDAVSNAPPFDKIRERMESGDILGFMHMGDRHYRDIATNDEALFQDAYNDVMSMARQNAMHLAGWVDYTWDDHDFGPNDSHSGSTPKPAAQASYRDHVPHWTLPVSDSIEHTYVIGRVRFIHLDTRSYRTVRTATDDASKTMIGATQKAWLKALVVSATEPVIVIQVGTVWNASIAGTDSWLNYSTERDELTDYFDAQGVTSKLFILAGDGHILAADDGTNSPGGIPVAQFAPLDAPHTADDGTYSEGIHKTEQQQYGTLHFTDDGTNVTVRARGWSVNSSSVEAEEFDMSVVY